MMTKTTPLQALAWVYAGVFLLVVALGYVPGVEDEEGRMFGLFKIDPIDDLLHLASGAWAGFAAWASLRQSGVFFRWFGAIYFLDGLVGAVVGKGFLDGAIFMADVPAIEGAFTRVAANVPHMLLGGVALYAGLVMARKRGSA